MSSKKKRILVEILAAHEIDNGPDGYLLDENGAYILSLSDDGVGTIYIEE